MSTPTTVPPIPETPQGLSEAERVIDTFVAPSKTFRDIRRDASWVVPFLICAIVSVCFMFVIDKKIGWDQIMQNEIAKNPTAQERIEKLPPEQRDNILRAQTKFSKIFAYGSPVLILVAYLVLAAVMLATFNFGFGASMSYMTSMAVVAYSFLPTILASLLGIVAIFAGVDPESFNIRNPIATNAAYFMDPGSHKFLYGLATGLDVFTFWVMILMAIGFSANSKAKKSTAFFAIFALFVLYKVGTSAAAAAFS